MKFWTLTCSPSLCVTFLKETAGKLPTYFLFIFSFSVNMDREKVTTYVQITRLVKPKIKKEGTITSNSLATLIEDPRYSSWL